MLAPYVAQAISPDDFENDAWEQCPSETIAHQWSGELAPVERQAEVRICWSNEALHVRFVCNQNEPLVVSANPQTDRKTLGLWDRDVCEIFVAPDAENPSRYFEFEAAPTGEWVDLCILITPSGRETDWDFQSGMEVAANLANTKLRIGISVPWSGSLPRPERGDMWRINLFRCVGPEAPERYLAWRPTRTPEPNFHVPEAFGSLEFN